MRATLALALGDHPACAAPAAARTNPIFQSPGIPPPGANDPACKPAAAHPYPVILVHGTFGDMTVSWNTIAPALEARGYCVWALDYGNRGTGDIDRSADQLVAFIAKVRSDTGAAKVSMIGHSQGGMLARYVTVRRGLLGVVDDVVGLAPSSHGTTNPLAGPAGGFGCTACAQQKAGSAFMRKVNQPPPEAPGPAWYTDVTTRTTRSSRRTVAGAGRRPRDQRDPAGQCPGDPFEHVTIVGDPVALQWAVNALEPPGAANPSFLPDCSGSRRMARPRRTAEPAPKPALSISLGQAPPASGIRLRCPGPRGAVCIGRLELDSARRPFGSAPVRQQAPCASRPAAPAPCSRARRRLNVRTRG